MDIRTTHPSGHGVNRRRAGGFAPEGSETRRARYQLSRVCARMRRKSSKVGVGAWPAGMMRTVVLYPRRHLDRPERVWCADKAVRL